MERGTGGDLLRRGLPYILILLISAVIRFHNLMKPLTFPGYSGTLSKNGADEGIFLMTSKLVSEGSRMYVDINTHQGPLFSFVFQLFNGDPFTIRIMTVLIGLLGMIGLMMITSSASGRRAAIIASLLLSFNFVFFKVSRQASFDLYCTVLLIFAFYLIIMYYRRRDAENDIENDRIIYLYLVLAGILLAASVMSKLFAVVPIISLGIYMFIGWIREWRRDRRVTQGLFHIIVLTCSTALAVLGMMSIYGFGNTLDGIFLSNLGRASVPLDRRIGVLIKFLLMASIPIMLSIVTIMKDRKDRTVQLILVWMLPLFLFILFQSAIWDHYLMILLPPLCFLAGRGFDILWRGRTTGDMEGDEKNIELSKKVHNGSGILSRSLLAVSLIFIIVSVAAITGLVAISDKEVEQDVADEVASLTDPDDAIICGDPIIGVYAGRLQPPEATNIAMVRSPPLTDRDLVDITCDEEVKVVVFTYNLANYDLYIEFIRENYDFHKAYTWTGKISTIEGEIEIDMDTFSIYVRPETLDLEQLKERFHREHPDTDR